MANGDRIGTYPYLPKMIPQQDIRPGRAGAWEHNGGLLDALGQGLDIQGVVDQRALTAIPTIWARPQLFAGALLDAGHPLHASVVDEWRGLLGLICFQHYNHFDIKLETIDFGQMGGVRQPFVSALMALLPDPPLAWQKLAVLKVGNVVIGGTSPQTFLYAAAQYNCPQCVPWMDRRTGRLVDPLKAFAQRAHCADELAVLKTWVLRLADNTRNNAMAGLDQQAKARLVQQLDNWANQIAVTPDATAQHDASLFLAHQLPAPYDMIPGAIIDNRGIVGDFFLKPTRKGAPSPIVVTEEGWKQHDRLVWRAISPDQVAYPGDSAGQELDNGRITHDWIRPDKYFLTDRILRMPLSDAHAVLFHRDGYIPPLRREVFDYFEPDDLEDLFTWEQVPGGIKVSLKIPLKTREGRERWVTVRKVYDADHTVEVSPAPFLEVWPNFRAEDWKHYYCIAQVPERTPFGCFPYPSDITPQINRRDVKIWPMTQLPQAVVCTWDDEPVGLIPIKQPAEAARPNLNWRVGLDFGTSNTTICVQDTIGAPSKKLVFANRCMQLTAVPPAPRKFFLFSNFLPPDDIPGLFPSHLRIIEERGTELPEPLVDGLLQFVDPLQWDAILLEKGTQVHENLKWSDDQRLRKYIATFLKQLFLMIAAEARVGGVSNIELRYSYPSAFSRKMLGQMRHFWNSIAGEATGLGLKLSVAPPQTESLGACKYLINERNANPVAPTRPLISIDVGGGTTDIAIWLGGELVAQSSLLLGGRELSHYAEKQPVFWERIEKILDIELDKTLYQKYPGGVLGILFKTRGDKLAHALAIGAGVLPVFKRARTLIFLMLSGALYYSGLLVRHLAESGHKIDSCDIFMGGNGANLVNWVTGPKEAHAALVRIFENGIGPAFKLAHIVIEGPDKPKEEVARGLVYDFGPGTAQRNAGAILGEQGYFFGVDPLAWDFDVYGNLDLMDPRQLKVPNDFPELDRFIKAFNDQCDELDIEELTQDVAHKTQIKASIFQAVARLQHAKDEALVQPFFVEEVRQMLVKLRNAPVKA